MTTELQALRRVEICLPQPTDSGAVFPFSIPALRSLEVMDTDAPVVLFVGENGSGKSTLMEALAIATRLPTVGSESAARDKTLEAQRRLADCLKLVWRRRTHRGFFLRAEDFFGFTRRLAELRLAFLAMIKSSVDDGSQFLIATHSPILMSIPGARILSFDQIPVRHVDFDDLEHVSLMRDFLSSPERFLQHLWTVEEGDSG